MREACPSERCAPTELRRAQPGPPRRAKPAIGVVGKGPKETGSEGDQPNDMELRWGSGQPNDFGFLLREQDADPEL